MASSTIKGLTIEIGGDTSKFGTAIKDAENKSKSLSKELTDVNKLLKLDPGNVELLAQKQQILTERVAATKDKLDILRQAESQVQAQFEKGDITAEQYRAFQREIAFTANEMQGYEKAIEKTTKQLAEAKVKTGEEASSLDMLKAKISLQEQELSKLTDQYKSIVLAEGENSDQAKELKAQYDALNSKLGESKQKLNEAETAAASLGQAEKTALSPMDSLKKTISEQEKELSALKDEYKNVVIEQGKDSDAARQLESQFDSLNKELQANQQKLNDVEQEANQLGQAEKNALTPLESLKKSVADQEKELDRLNTEYQNTVIQYGKNSDEAKALASQIKTLSTEHQNEKAKLQEAQKATESITSTEKTLTERYKDQKSELSALKQQYVNAAAQYGANSKEAKALAKQISSLSGEIAKEDKKIQSAEKAADKFDKTLVDTSGDSNKTAKNVEKLSDSAKNAESGFNAAAVAVGTFMGNLALNVLNDAANLMKQITEGALDTGSSFEAAMSQVAATQGFSISDIQNNTEGAAYTMDLLTEKAREMGAATSFSAAQAADGLNILLMSGYSAENSIGMVENVLHEAEAGGISIAEAAQYIAGSMKGFKKQSAEFADSAEASAYYADLIAKGATLAATNVPQLGQGLSGVAATANTYNQKADSVTISLLRLAEQGEVGAGAATALTAAMKNLYSPTDTAKAALEELGISAYDAEGNTRDFNVVVGELDNALSQLTEERRNSLEDAIFGIQGQAAFDKMVVTSGDKLQKFYDGIAEASGSAALQSETMLDNLKGDITKLQSAYSDLEITIYNGANEPLRHVVQTITDDMLPAINHLVSGVDEADKEIGSAVGNLVSTILTETKDLLPTLTGVANNIVLALVENLPQMASGFGEMVLTLLKGLTDILPKILPAMSKSIRQIISKTFSNIKNLAGIVKKLVEILASNFLRELPKLGYTFANILDTIAQDLIPGFSKSFQKLLTKILRLIKKNLPAILNSLKRIIKSLTSGLKPIFSELIPELLKTAVKLLVDGIPLIVSTASELLGAIADALPDLLEALGTAPPQVIDAITDFFSDKENLDKLKDTGKKLLERIATSIKDNISVFQKKAPGIMQKIRDKLKEAIPKMTSVADKIITNITDSFGVSDEWQKLKTTFSEVFAGVPDEVEEQFKIFKETVGEAFDRLKESADNLKEAAKNLFDNLKDLFNIDSKDANGMITTIVDIAGAIASISVDAVGRAIEVISDFLLWISSDSFGAEATRDAIVGIVTAIATFKTLNGAINIIQNLPNLLSGLSGGFTGLWGVVAANPLLALISLLVGLVGALVYVAKTSEEWQIGWQMIKDAFNDAVDSWKVGEKALKDFGGKIYDFVQDVQDSWNIGVKTLEYFGESVYDFFHETIPQELDRVLENAKKWGEDFLLNFVGGVSENINPLHDTFESLGEWIYERFHFSTPDKGVLADSDTWFPDMMENFANGVSNNKNLVLNQLIIFSDSIAEQAQNAGKNFLNGVLSFTEKLPGNLGVHLTSTVNNVIDWGKNLRSKAVSATSDMVNAVESIARTLPDKMTEVGRNLVLGLWNGMNSLQNWILSNTSDFCNNILNQIYDTFDIHSPAKTMVYVGEMLDYGVAGGVTENEDEPIRAIRQMAHNLLNEAAVIPERLPVQKQQYQVPDMQTIATNSILSEKLDRILQAIENGQVLMLDGNKLVGATADRMNTALGQIQVLSARR